MAAPSRSLSSLSSSVYATSDRMAEIPLGNVFADFSVLGSICCPLHSVCCLLSTVYCLLSAVCCPLSDVYCVRSDV
jgi:hypothetical protein